MQLHKPNSALAAWVSSATRIWRSWEELNVAIGHRLRGSRSKTWMKNCKTIMSKRNINQWNHYSLLFHDAQICHKKHNSDPNPSHHLQFPLFFALLLLGVSSLWKSRNVVQYVVQLHNLPPRFNPCSTAMHSACETIQASNALLVWLWLPGISPNGNMVWNQVDSTVQGR